MSETSAVPGPWACACCGCLTLSHAPILSAYESCPVCCWTDDPAQRKDPDLDGGANDVSLVAARKNYIQLGACAPSLVPYARPARPDELP